MPAALSLEQESPVLHVRSSSVLISDCIMRRQTEASDFALPMSIVQNPNSPKCCSAFSFPVQLQYQGLHAKVLDAIALLQRFSQIWLREEIVCSYCCGLSQWE